MCRQIFACAFNKTEKYNISQLVLRKLDNFVTTLFFVFNEKKLAIHKMRFFLVCSR